MVYIFLLFKNIIYMSSNVGFYPGSRGWFAVQERLTKYSLWAKSSLLGLWAKKVLTFLNGYISNGYISTYVVFLMLLLGQQIFNVWPLKKNFADSWLWILLYLREESWFLFLQAANLAQLNLLALCFLWKGAANGRLVSAVPACGSGVGRRSG